jgi:hypothetical protein
MARTKAKENNREILAMVVLMARLKKKKNLKYKTRKENEGSASLD